MGSTCTSRVFHCSKARPSGTANGIAQPASILPLSRHFFTRASICWPTVSRCRPPSSASSREHIERNYTTPTFIILLCVPPASVQPTWTPVNEPFQPSLPVHPTLHLVVPQAPCINLQRPQPVANVCSVHSTGFPHFAPYSSATALYVLLFCGMDDVEHCR